MLISSLEQMEKIVSSQDDLSWEGWTVVKSKPIKDGGMTKNAVRIKGDWFLQTRFELTDAGWNIPNNLMR